MSSLLFGNGTDMVHWKSSPTTRGTFDILTTCIITMLLCVWTAVHLNVSPPGSVWGPRLRKIGWLILALIAPEMIAYTAWHQRQHALMLMRAFNQAFVLPNPPSWQEKMRKHIEKIITDLKMVFENQKQEPFRQPTLEAQRYPLPKDRHPWTIVHGFYAAMGGLAFEIPEAIPESKKFLPSDRGEISFLSEELIERLLDSDHNELFPDLSEEEIQSKSKANGLAKSLVCIQALWFIAQCITRLVQHIPISLLELNTFGHAVCALLIYLLWWEKPFEVDYPTMIKGQIFRDLYALDWMRANRSPAIESYSRDLTAYRARDKWFQALPKEAQKNFKKSLQTRPDAAFFLLQKRMQGEELGTDNEVGSTILMPRQTIQGTEFKVQDLGDLTFQDGIANYVDRNCGSHSPCPHIRLTTEDVTRYKMAWRAVEFNRRQRELSPLHVDKRSWYHGFPSALVQRSKDWPGLENTLEPLVGLGFTTAGLIYGGLHALAWFAHFESSTQQLLWRVSACVVMGGFPVFWVLLKSLDYIEDHIPIRVRLEAVYSRPALTVLALVVLAYILARAYLVIECFINLSHLPAGVYDVPKWASYFPHIS